MSDTLEQVRTASPTVDDMIMEAARPFVVAVRHIPHVQRVLVEEDRLPTNIWTVISAPPFDPAYTTPVYEAELTMLQKPEFPLVRFRLVNVQEMDGDYKLPTSLKTVFERS